MKAYDHPMSNALEKSHLRARLPVRSGSRYRLRTWLRGNLPEPVNWLFPKGQDCGDHEWYRHDDPTDHCYHCRVSRPHQPIDAPPISAELHRALNRD
jgi:hypothetical protein